MSVNGLRLGASATIAPTLRSRFAQPSRRLPMPGRERIVDGGVAQRALDAHRLDAAVGVREGGHADDRVELEQRDRRRRILEVDLAGLDLFHQRAGQRVRVHLQPDGQRRLRAKRPRRRRRSSGRRSPCAAPARRPRTPRCRRCRSGKSSALLRASAASSLLISASNPALPPAGPLAAHASAATASTAPAIATVTNAISSSWGTSSTLRRRGADGLTAPTCGPCKFPQVDGCSRYSCRGYLDGEQAEQRLAHVFWRSGSVSFSIVALSRT